LQKWKVSDFMEQISWETVFLESGLLYTETECYCALKLLRSDGLIFIRSQLLQQHLCVCVVMVTAAAFSVLQVEHQLFVFVK